MRPWSNVGPLLLCGEATPAPEEKAVKGAALVRRDTLEQALVTSEASRLDRYFAAVTIHRAARRLGRLTAPRHDPADWFQDSLG
jgi:hypothetical protein